MLMIVPTRAPSLLCCHEAATSNLPAIMRKKMPLLAESTRIQRTRGPPLCPGRLESSVLWECSPGLQVGPESPPFADCYLYLAHPFRACGWPLGLHSVSSLDTVRARLPCLPGLIVGSAPTLEPPGAQSVPLSACTCLTSPKCRRAVKAKVSTSLGSTGLTQPRANPWMYLRVFPLLN